MNDQHEEPEAPTGAMKLHSPAPRAPVTTRQGLKGAFTLVPQTLAQAQQVAEILARSQFVPDCFRGKPGDVMAAVMYGAELGLGPMASLQNIAVINGRPSIWGDAVMALLAAHPAFRGINEEFEGGPIESLTAVCQIWRRGHSAPFVGTFSYPDAKRAGLLDRKGPWHTYPKDMLMWKARHRAVRQGFADMLKGLAFVEDSMDIEVIEGRSTREARPAIQAPRALSEKQADELTPEPRTDEELEAKEEGLSSDDSPPMTDAARKKIFAIASKKGVTNEEMKAYMDVRSFNDIPLSDAPKLVEWLEEFGDVADGDA